MANTKISALTSLGAVPASGDYVPIVDVSDTTQAASGTTKKITASFFAFLGQAQTFTTTQTITPSATNVVGLNVNMPASTSALAQTWQYNGTTRAQVFCSNSTTYFALSAFDNGSGLGPSIIIDRNNNASTPAAGNARLTTRGGTDEYVWPDSSGNLRIGTTSPTNANDSSGTVVGAQTSWHELKQNIAAWTDYQAALDAILATNLYQYEMAADSELLHDGTKPIYHGLVITDEDRDNDVWFAANLAAGQVPSLNERNLFGYLIAAIKTLTARIEAMEGD